MPVGLIISHGMRSPDEPVTDKPFIVIPANAGTQGKTGRDWGPDQVRDDGEC